MLLRILRKWLDGFLAADPLADFVNKAGR